MKRFSGLLAARPSAASARFSFYYATDTQEVYEEEGGSWVLRERQLDNDEVMGRASGTLAARPQASSMVGWLYRDETGKLYEAFPDGWAELESATAFSPELFLEHFGIPSFASLAAANAALTIGKIFHNSTTNTLEITTA